MTFIDKHQAKPKGIENEGNYRHLDFQIEREERIADGVAETDQGRHDHHNRYAGTHPGKRQSEVGADGLAKRRSGFRYL